MPKKQPSYIVTGLGINYVPVGGTEEVRREQGDTADGIPPEAVAWLLADGEIAEQAKPVAPPDAAPEEAES